MYWTKKRQISYTQLLLLLKTSIGVIKNKPV